MSDFLCVSYGILFLYHVLDSLCDFSCCYNLLQKKQFNDLDQNDFAIITTCLLGAPFKFMFFYRVPLGKFLWPDIGKIDLSRVLSPEINFYVLEGLVNLFQSGLSNSKISSSGSCIDGPNFIFECCCFAGGVLQLVCFVCSFACGSYGRQEDQCWPNVVANIFGILFSFLSLCIALDAIVNKAGQLPFC